MSASRSLRGVLWNLIQQSLKSPVKKRRGGTLVASPPLASRGIPASLLKDFLVRHATDGEFRAVTAVQLLWRPGGDPTVRVDDQVSLEVEFEGGSQIPVPLTVWTPQGSISWEKVSAVHLPDGDGGNAVAHFTAILDMPDRKWRYFHYFMPLISEKPQLRRRWGVWIHFANALFGRFRKQTPFSPKQDLSEWFDNLLASSLLLGLSSHGSVFIPLEKGRWVVAEWTRQEVEREVYGTGVYSRRRKKIRLSDTPDADTPDADTPDADTPDTDTPDASGFVEEVERIVSTDGSNSFAELTASDSFADTEQRIALQQRLERMTEQVTDLKPREKDALQALADNDSDYDVTAAKLDITKERLYSYISVIRKKLLPYRHFFN